MCNCNVKSSWLYKWELRCEVEGGQVLTQEGAFYSGLDSTDENKEVILNAVNRALEALKLQGLQITRILDFTYKIL